MKNSEEKIKEFFSSEENIKKLMSNEEFMNKISDGVVDAKTYQSEFKKLGLDLTDEEADQAVGITNKLVDISPEKLEEISLENIAAGGHNYGGKTACLRLIASLSGLVTAFASIACNVKSKKYEKSGNMKKALEYAKKSRNLGIASANMLPVSLLMTTF